MAGIEVDDREMMQSGTKHLLDILWHIVRRVWWASLLAIHVHPFVSTIRGLMDDGLAVGRVLALAGLIALMTFFVLKIIDVRFLRHHTRPKALIIFWIVTAMVHNNAATVALEAVSSQPAPAAILAGATVAGIALRRRSGRVLSKILRRFYGGLIWRRRIQISRLRCVIGEVGVSRRRFYDRPSGCALRGPPLCDIA